MSVYVEYDLTEFQHKAPKTPQYAPDSYVTPQNISEMQMT